MSSHLPKKRPNHLAGLLACLVIGIPAAPQPVTAATPSVTVLFPPVVQAGRAASITVSGGDLGTLTGLISAGGELQTSSVTKSVINVNVSRDTRAGLLDAWTLTSTGLSNPRALLVVTHPVKVVAETPDSQAPAISLPGTAAAQLARTADRDVFAFTGQSGQLVHLACRSRSLDGTVSPVLTVHGPKGRELAHSFVHQVEPTLALKLPADGRYLVTVVDRGFQQDASSLYTLTLETGPRLQATSPTAICGGGKLLVLGHELPFGPAHSQTGLSAMPVALDRFLSHRSWPDRRPVGVLDSGFRLRLSNCSGTAWVTHSHEPVVTETSEQNDTAATAQLLEPPVRICGAFERSADVDWYAVDVQKGETREIVGWGERLGQSMRLEAIVHDRTGKALATIAPPAAPKKTGFDFPYTTYDPHASWKAPADGRFRIVVRDIFGGSIFGPDRVYQLVISPPRKRFQAFSVVGDGKTHSGLSIAAGGKATLQVLVIRMGGAESPVEVTAEDLPNGVTAATVTVAAGKPVATLTLEATAQAKPTQSPIRLVAKTGTDNSGRPVLPVVHLPGPAPVRRVTDALMLSVTPTSPPPPKKAPADKTTP